MQAKVDFSNKDIVFSDYIASTEHTLLATIKELQDQGVNSIYCMVTHGLFIENAYQILINEGAKAIWSTDSIAHESNQIELADRLASAINP